MKLKTIRNRVEFNLYPDEESYQTPVSLSFEVDQDMTLEVLHKLCRYFALCLSFSPESVDEVFGEACDNAY